MKIDEILCNKPVPIPIREKAEKLLNSDEKPLFAVVGDFLLNARFGNSVLIVTDSRLICVEEDDSADGFFIPLSEIENVKIKRMYSNAVLRINDKNVMRFSFSVIAVMEAAAEYIKAVKDGGDRKAALEIVQEALEKLNSYCPKCGRSLIRPGADCINCISKGKLVKRLLVYILPQKNRLIFCLALSVVTTAMALVPPYITKMLVDDVIPNSNLRLLFILVGLLLGVYIIQCLVGALRSRHMRLAGDKIVTDLRNDVYEKAQYLSVDFYDKTSTGSMYSRISGDTSTLNAFMLRISQEAIVQFFLMVGIMVIMIVLNWRLALLSLLPVPVVAMGAKAFGKRIHPMYHKIWLRWSSVCSLLSDTLPGIRVIKAFTGEKRAIDKFNEYNNAWYNESKRASLIGSIFPQAVTFFITCGSLVIWGVGGSWAIKDPGLMSAGMLVSFISYASMFYGPVNFFANLSDSYRQALTSAERLLDILDAEPEKDFGKGNTVSSFKGRIEFRHISFAFDKTTKTLDDINIVIEPGDIIGIVGTTGAGKTTLINLLMRFYDNYEGEILIDGRNIRDIDLESYREQLGFVQQEPLMFHDSIFSNIAFSKPDALVEEVISAADVANAHSFITRLPDAYDTILGERGVGLSGGERQRLSIARAVLKNPSVLIFDEATASVDSETEHLIQEAIERLISGRTTLMIAHRLSTLRRANKIVVIDKGKVLEFGSHEELMALKGKYYKLVEIQGMSEEIRRKASEEHLEQVIV